MINDYLEVVSFKGENELNGVFITLEGGEGAGKTSILEPIKEELNNRNYDVLITREPGGIEISEKIREVILDPNHTIMDARTEALLYAAARRQHLIEKVIPALKSGKVVLCDRFIDSSLAYQGFARGLGMEDVLKINEFAIDQCMPHLTLLLDIDPKKGLERISKNIDREKNRLDLESLKFHQKVYKGYHILARKFNQRIKVINADQSIEEVKSSVLSHIIYHLEKSDRKEE